MVTCLLSTRKVLDWSHQYKKKKKVQIHTTTDEHPDIAGTPPTCNLPVPVLAKVGHGCYTDVCLTNISVISVTADQDNFERLLLTFCWYVVGMGWVSVFLHPGLALSSFLAEAGLEVQILLLLLLLSFLSAQITWMSSVWGPLYEVLPSCMDLPLGNP